MKARTFPRRFYQLAGLALAPSAVALGLGILAARGALFTDKNLVLLLWASLVAAVVAGISLVVATRSLDRRLDEILGAIKQFGVGALDFRLRVPREDFVRELSLAVNQMGARLGTRLAKAQQRAIDEAAILSTMAEGILVVDGAERVVRMNDAARNFFAGHLTEVKGRLIEEVVLNAELQRFIRKLLRAKESAETEIVLLGEPERHLRIYGRPLKTDGGDSARVLVVCTDISRLRHLEMVRREFVSNVSHELRTPITSIKGFVETLLDGAINDPNEAQRFLEIIDRQADRLDAIFEDLLSLSRIEQGEESASIRLESGDVTEISRRVVEACELQARSKGVGLSLTGERVVSPRVNASLLEQAITNLVTNALAHTESGGRVSVAVEESADEYIVAVRDTGCGIDKAHLGRLFERFYRVDKARTRKAGGTGLGLSIVKHIAHVHGGRATVESTVGVGSTFRLHLPKVRGA
jgi:two-component system phosphate regulon sensor histidine kinase PhoR